MAGGQGRKILVLDDQIGPEHDAPELDMICIYYFVLSYAFIEY